MFRSFEKIPRKPELANPTMATGASCGYMGMRLGAVVSVSGVVGADKILQEGEVIVGGKGRLEGSTSVGRSEVEKAKAVTRGNY